tara:strand:- start:27828 stop:28427 length:600 start_codon:yes stop_codon:yes gene_type:complete
MSKLKGILILGTGLLLSVSLTWLLHDAWQETQRSYKRVLSANVSLQEELIEFRTENGQLVAQNRVLELKSKELAALLPQMASEIKQLGVKLSRAESVTTAGFEVKTPATVLLRDSIIYDTVPVKLFSYDDGFFDIEGTAIGDQQQLNLAYRDTLVQVVYRGERERPWLWIFSPRKLMQRVSLKNPNAQIEYTQHIEIED